MVSETDPLLPKGNTAPEISGPGFFKPKIVRASEDASYPHHSKTSADVTVSAGQSKTNGKSPLTTIIALFTTVVGIAGVIALLFPGALRSPSGKGERATPPDHHDINARVEKILSQTPLIGWII